jgi:hypothetical protein
MFRPAEWSFSSHRISSISNAASTVSMSAVARIVPCGRPSALCAALKMSFQSRASRCDSIFGR